jgi:uncharacterized protein (TIGR00369 family)
MNSKFFMDNQCFACGSENPHGLKLQIKEKDSGVEAVIKPPLWTQGYHNTVHGGIVSTILDEMTVWAAFFKADLKCVTGELNIRIRDSMHVNQKYIARAEVLCIKHRLVIAEAQIVDNDNKLIAQAQAKLIRIGHISN